MDTAFESALVIVALSFLSWTRIITIAFETTVIALLFASVSRLGQFEYRPKRITKNKALVLLFNKLVEWGHFVLDLVVGAAKGRPDIFVPKGTAEEEEIPEALSTASSPETSLFGELAKGFNDAIGASKVPEVASPTSPTSPSTQSNKKTKKKAQKI